MHGKERSIKAQNFGNVREGTLRNVIVNQYNMAQGHSYKAKKKKGKVCLEMSCHYDKMNRLRKSKFRYKLIPQTLFLFM